MKLFELLGQRPIKGDVGIEIEVEGRNLPDVIPKAWKVHGDGSLRGESFEYVTKGAVPLAKVGDVMNILNEAMADSRVDDSPRCGVHIHINIQEMEFDQLCSFIVLYLCFEEVLVKWCGPDRVGNLFCLRVSDASGSIDALEAFMRTKSFRHIATDQLRYGSMNPKAITQHGSLEFRAMRGTVDKDIIVNWVGMLSAIKAYAMEHNPQELIGNFSIKGAQDFFNDVLGPYREVLRPDTYDLMIGMRNAQELAFCRQWGEEEVAVQPEAPAFDVEGARERMQRMLNRPVPEARGPRFVEWHMHEVPDPAPVDWDNIGFQDQPIAAIIDEDNDNDN